MATRSTISIVDKRANEGRGETIYCHWDGYPSNNGRILLEHYQDANKVKELIGLGNISSLAENVSPTNEPHSFDEPHKGVVVAYMRDRGEKDCNASSFYGKEPSNKIAQEYDYLFVVEENKWYVRDNHKAIPKFVELTEKICDKN